MPREPHPNGGHLVVETLERLGASTVFGIPGQHALALFDALADSGLRLVGSRVENNAAFSADGYSRATGEVGVLLLSTGPGALTSLAGLQEAYASCVPVVAISSEVPRAGLGGVRTGMLHQLDDQQASAANVTKSTRVVRATGAGAVAAMAAGTIATLATMVAVGDVLANEPIYFGLGAGLVAFVVVSLATPRTGPAIMRNWTARVAGRAEVAEQARA